MWEHKRKVDKGGFPEVALLYSQKFRKLHVLGHEIEAFGYEFTTSLLWRYAEND